MVLVNYRIMDCERTGEFKRLHFRRLFPRHRTAEDSGQLRICHRHAGGHGSEPLTDFELKIQQEKCRPQRLIRGLPFSTSMRVPAVFIVGPGKPLVMPGQAVGQIVIVGLLGYPDMPFNPQPGYSVNKRSVDFLNV